MRYIFRFPSGHGIGEIWAHTIETQYIPVNAENIEEALSKVEKKRWNVYKHNKVYGSDKFIVFDGSKTGIVYKKFNKIVWEGESLYHGMSAWQFYKLQKFVLPTCKYSGTDNNWIANYIFSTNFPTYGDAMDYTYERHNFAGFSRTIEENLERYYYEQIEILLTSEYLTEEEKQSIIIKPK